MSNMFIVGELVNLYHLSRGRLVIVVFFVEVAASDESSDRADAKFPGVEAGVLDGDLLVVGSGLTGEIYGCTTGEDSD
jgi:hypothetical protein